MKARWISLVGLLIVPLLLSACSSKTGLRFNNKTECGTATITILNTETGNIAEIIVPEGEKHEIELDHDVEYNYTVEYPRQPDFIVCDKKEVSTILSNGQMLNITLESIRSPELDITDTPES